MKKECTEQDLRELARSAQAVFEAVTLTEAPLCDGWQDDGLRVDYELRNGRVDCVLHRRVEADGKCWELEMCAPLAGNVLPEERMTPRERELCREDMSHDFLTGVYNRRYLETVFAQKLEQCAAQGRKAAVALVSIDNGQKLRDTYGQPVMDQLHCFVGNQWKKSFDTPATRVVCRLTGSIFAVGCLDADGKQLAEEMQNLYRQMPRECITTTGMMHRVQFTMSGAAAGLDLTRAVYAQQVHSAEVRIAHAADAQPPELEPRFACDGFVTNEPGVPLAVFMADCLPVLLHDPAAGVIGAVHCGWRGSVADILGAAVAQMCALGAHPADIRAAIGPGIGACCFEVGPEVVAAAEALLHAPLGALARPRADGKALLDLKGVNARRLVQLGVPAGQITVSDACTMCRPDVFWSHRATDGRRGVQAAVITL